MTETDTGGWADALSDALEQLRVADTLGELRREVDSMIHGVEADDSPVDERRVDGLSRRVEAAGNLLGELTDLLEGQSERLETIESRLDVDDDAALDEELAAWRERLGTLESRLDGLAESGGLEPSHELDGLLKGLHVTLSAVCGRLDSLESKVESSARNSGLDTELVASKARLAEVEKQLGAEKLARESATAEQQRKDDLERERAEEEQKKAAARREARRGARRKASAQDSGTPMQRRKRQRPPSVAVFAGDGTARARICIDLSRRGLDVLAGGGSSFRGAAAAARRVDAVILSADLGEAEGRDIRAELERNVSGRVQPIVIYDGVGLNETQRRRLFDAWQADEIVAHDVGVFGLVEAVLRSAGNS